VSRRSKWLLAGALALLMAYGVRTQFTLSRQWLAMSYWLLPAITLLSITCACVLGLGRSLIEGGKSRLAKTGRLFLTAVGVSVPAIIIGAHALPALGTWAFGSEQIVDVTIGRKFVEPRRRRLFNHLFHHPFHASIQIRGQHDRLRYRISEYHFAYLGKPLETRARIRWSWFGTHVMEIYPTSNSFGAVPHLVF
jgi:hypothetical protein